ncbi:glycoside hydrolase family 76 protein [Suillus occidentalis]|nr:glycoside hydrolase family 76 protein [Suillus occidentalis]
MAVMLFRLSIFLAAIAALLELVADQLQLHYYNSSTGQYNLGELWTDANTLEDLHNLMLASGSDDYEDAADTSYIAKAALEPNTDWAKFLGGSNDDAQWIILALWKIADYKSARRQDNSAYISSAAKIYDMIAREWDDTCGGGVWWSTEHTYKNAITNELFLLTSAAGYLRTKNEAYLENANKPVFAVIASGMRGPNGLFNDGLDLKTCQNNGQTTWTYNQAVVASGLAALYAATGNTSLLDQAEVSLDATIGSLTGNGILRESCDLADETCNHDQVLVSGLNTVQYYLDNANDTSHIAKYSQFLGSQYSGILLHATNSAHDIGSVWYTADQGQSQWSPEASASGLQAFISAAKYGPC